MMVVIAIANQKGGVGKTTTAITLGHGLAQRGYRALVIDLDSQGNVADSLGLPAGNDLYRWLFPDMEDTLAAVITHTGRRDFDVIRSDKSTVQLKAALAGSGLAGLCLQAALEHDLYDAALIDCAPSVDLLHTAALVAADYLIIPTRLDQLAVKGVRDVLQSLTSINRMATNPCELAGILPTFYDRVTRESHKQLTHLISTFGKKVMPPVPLDTVCRVATRLGKTLWEFAPETRALVGISNGTGQHIGGYQQVLDQIEELME